MNHSNKKNKSKKFKIIIVVLLLLLTTGCTTTLTDKNNKPVKNEVTGQNLTKNIICQPRDKDTIQTYKDNGVNIDKLPECSEFKITSGKYESLWTSFFIKPLAFILLLVGKTVGNYAISVIILSLVIRLIAYPVTKKTALQSELIKKAQPELDRLQKKYKDKTDQESIMKQNQEMMMIYKKYNINPLSGCLFSFLQLPLFIAFFEAIRSKFFVLPLKNSTTLNINLVMGVINHLSKKIPTRRRKLPNALLNFFIYLFLIYFIININFLFRTKFIN